MIVTTAEAIGTVAFWREDPNAFIRDVLGAALYAKQQEIAAAAAQAARLSVVGANATGKDFVAGRLIPWWLCTRYPAKVLALGPTHRQVQLILWNEFRNAYWGARAPLGGVMYETPAWDGLRADGMKDGDHFARGFATDSPYNIQGFHSPNLLVILTEAHALPQRHVDAIWRLMPKLVVMTGNPFVLVGEFYDSHHSKRADWNPISISAFDSPNVRQARVVIPGLVTAEDIERMRRDWGEADPRYVAAVLGQFPDALEDTLIPLNKAVEATALPLQPGRPNVIACDVARMGSDRTVIVHRRGPVATIARKLQGRDTVQVAAAVAEAVGSWNAEARRLAAVKPDLVEAVVIDDVGVGGGVTDQLRRMRLGCRVVAFQGGGNPSRQGLGKYANAVTEVWWLMAQEINGGRLGIPKDENLISQLATRQYEIQTDRKLRIQSKEDMRPSERMERASWKSPDEADALAMTFAPGAASGGFKVWTGVEFEGPKAEEP